MDPCVYGIDDDDDDDDDDDSEDANWHENVENVHIFPFADFVKLTYQFACKRSKFLLPIRAHHGTAMFVCHPSEKLIFNSSTL